MGMDIPILYLPCYKIKAKLDYEKGYIISKVL